MVKKIIFISFLVFMMSCNAIGRGVLIDSILNKVIKDFAQEEEEEKKENSNSKPSINENTDDDSEEESEEEEEDIE
ncbi:hypothetical protein QIA36_00495 (plasmid) [Borreliella yangtzensis]|uniref:hypothetical protein n=1 Tax=Borreliella yangtzensis TaxID=683292 RepID=UPI0026484F95|nr:hypothetical protein [Borreliella yangtzensis]WKC74833.1 hypothetical protein QIA36_00495 [Borreliella yangtzensis]